jgi:hypothetical protein
MPAKTGRTGRSHRPVAATPLYKIQSPDDEAIRLWVEAKLFGDEAAARDLWDAQIPLSEEASRLKTQFLDEYNALRASLIGLPPLDVRY